MAWPADLKPKFKNLGPQLQSKVYRELLCNVLGPWDLKQKVLLFEVGPFGFGTGIMQVEKILWGS